MNGTKHWGQSNFRAETIETGGTDLSSVLDVKAENKYTAAHGHAGRGYPWLKEGRLIEPFTKTHLKISSEEEFTDFQWHIHQVSNLNTPNGQFNHSSHTSEPHITLEFPTIGNYEVQLVASDPERAIHGIMKDVFFCRYVRRDVRHLDNWDRDMFLDAMQMLVQLQKHEGQDMFGDSYKTLDDYVQIHLDQAGNKLCDHMHDGLGFLTQHMALTNQFETALQLVSPKVTVPYWDFTLDKYEALGSDNPSVAIWDQELWTGNWFGNTSGTSFAVSNGRFAFQKITMDFNLTVRNPFGYMRAPWNMNKSPYLTRVHNFCGEYLNLETDWPSCETHWDWTFAGDYESWYTYAWHAPYAPHATIHSYIGGYTQCGNVTEELKALGIDMPTMEKAMGHLLINPLIFVKSLWRFGYAESPTYCTMDTPASECHLICNEKIDNITWDKSFMHHAQWLGDWEELFPIKWFPAVMKVMCNTPWASGEQLEAASPADPSFWPIHPTLERLFQYKRMVGNFSTTEWTNPDGKTEYCIYSSQSDCEGHHAE